MNCEISSNIKIYDPTSEVARWVHSELTLDNPDYVKKRRMNLSTYKTPKTVQLYKVVGNTLYLPYGTLSDVVRLVGKENCRSNFRTQEKVDYGANTIPLYDYQEIAVNEMMKAHYGILQSKAGSGKTQMGIAMIMRYSKRALWITHTKDLLNQSMERAKKYIPSNLIGTIVEGKANISEGVTFATVQTLSKMDLLELRDIWDLIIVDECHRCCTNANDVTMFEKVLNNLCARHKYGLSATVHRADGLIKGCFALLGNIKYIVPDEAIANRVMNVTVKPIGTDTKLSWDYLDSDGTIKWNRLIDLLVDDDTRCQQIVDNIDDRPTLVLSCRLEHLEKIRSMLPKEKYLQSVFISGKMNTKKGKAERENALQEMRQGTKQYLFATYSLAKEGLDIPRLEKLIMATPEKDYAVIVQSVGRVSRTCEGKQSPIVIDVVDSNIKTLVRKYKERCRIYKKENIRIESD